MTACQAPVPRDLASSSAGNPSDNIDEGSNSNNENPNSPAPIMSAGRIHFDTKVKPVFQSTCTSCHFPPPPFNGNGPMTIFNYDNMRVLLLQGPSASNNSLINKTQNLVAHVGGNQCSAGINASPCKEILDWWQIEINQPLSGITGSLDTVDSLARVTGWAKSVSQPNAKLTIYLYNGGPVGVGTLIGSALADLPGPGGIGGGHYFTYTLPTSLRTGNLQTLYAYAIEAKDANIVPGAPKPWRAYPFRQNAMDFYESTVRPLIQNRCSSCHGLANYNDNYLSLSNPFPASGGTAMNNTLINKAAGENHVGGNICGNKSTSPCAQIQQWWALEFQ